jgi:hypothetical protein
MPGSKRPLTQQEKDRIIYLASQGTEISEIARELNVDPRRITGYVRTMINAGRIPNISPRNTSPEIAAMGSTMPQSQVPQAPPAVPVAPAVPQASPQPSYAAPPPPPPQAGPAQDGWVGGRPMFGSVSGFQNQAQQVRTVIERKIPNDGILGEHFGELTRERICDIYGEGTYKVIRYEPGKTYPTEYEVQASAAFGPPRTPKRTTTLNDQNRPALQRPWMGQAQRPWDRSYERGEDEDGRGAPPPRAYAPQPYYSRPDPSLSEYARHNPMNDVASAAATEAIKSMGASQDKLIEQLDKSRSNGPDNFMTKFFTEQQVISERRAQDDERRRDQERKDEDAKYERRQREQETDHRRRQEEARLQHERELERIKAEAQARDSASKEERKMLMELEDKKLQVIRDEHRMRQEALQDELKRNREELKTVHERTERERKEDHEKADRERKEDHEKMDKKISEVQQSTSSQIAESNERLEKELERERETLEREHKLKEKAMDQRNNLEQQIIEIKKESLQSQGGDQIFQTINTVIKEFSKGLEKIVDLKKLEAMTPEAQAAAVAKGTIDGNVMGEPKRDAPPEQPKGQQQQAPQGQSPPDAQAPRNNGNSAGPSGAAPKGEQKNEESQMEQIIQDMLDKPFFRQVIKEWSLHVKTNQDPTTFANMYMEWMRDPLDHEGRKATTMFANFMKPREWSDMMKIMGPKLDKDVSNIFKSEAATDFYDGFKAMVVEQIRDYWEQFLAARKAQRAAQTAAGEAAAAEAPSEAPASEEGKK